MDLDALFQAYYAQYRAEDEVPSSTDSEYIVATRLFNEAINRWANYDGVYWKELFSTLQAAADGTKTISDGTATYAAPTDFREAGGFIKIKDSGVTKQNIPIVSPEEAQFKSDQAKYAYFTGNTSDGFTLTINPTPDSAIDGMDIEYVYYKKASEFSTGTDTTEIANPYFLVHHALANRFRASRNSLGYQTAKRDAEEALKVMKVDNDSGTWANPWQIPDRSGSFFGNSSGAY